ncbi:hypothetical protein [Microlunatus parietis]|uniref:Uncharacterized protein n=1 Tax=Microlunatus parietis TaxID=682979 RepID=A0A7Y9I5K1_9ACTN|nr:hypothetical protein [Microlunatus parietis]NYE70602.1 hypothetical protein [Microlunatus parietis]
MIMESPPIGSVLSRVWWWSTPDRYAGPARFDTLAKARRHGPAPVISVEVVLTTPDDREIVTRGGVPSADTMWRRSTRQEDGVLPVVGAGVIEVVPTGSTGILEIVFRNPDGSRFVLIPTN